MVRGGRPGLHRGGKLTDLVVLSDDIMTVPDDEIPDIEALIIILGGEVVYEREWLFVRALSQEPGEHDTREDRPEGRADAQHGQVGGPDQQGDPSS